MKGYPSIDRATGKMLTVYLELWQDNSLGGVFDPTNNEFYLTLFDIEPFNQCMMGPKEFLKVVAPHGEVEDRKMVES